MKALNFFAVAMTLVTALTASAGRPGFIASGGGSSSPILNSPTPVAQYRLNVPFAPETGSETVTIMDDGTVVHKAYFRNHSNVVTININETIATLDLARLAVLVSKASTILASDLVDPNAGQPPCLDAPTKAYTVFQNGVEVEIETLYGCHHAENVTEEARTIATVLKGLVALAHAR